MKRYFKKLFCFKESSNGTILLRIFSSTYYAFFWKYILSNPPLGTLGLTDERSAPRVLY